MKKILLTTVYNLISSAIVLCIATLIFVPFWVSVFIYATLNLSNLLTLILYEYVTIKNIKTLFKRLWFWLRYKSVKEIKRKSCYGCIFDNIGCGYSAFKCWNSNTIVIKRSYNPIKLAQKTIWNISNCFIICKLQRLCKL